jgi:cytochrome c oxidase subunit IV
MKEVLIEENDIRQIEPSITSVENSANESMNSKVAILIWLALIALSAIAAYIGEFSDTADKMMLPILLILVIKAQLIIDYFMGLKRVRTFWRLSMSAFAVVISVIIWGVL